MPEIFDLDSAERIITTSSDLFVKINQDNFIKEDLTEIEGAEKIE